MATPPTMNEQVNVRRTLPASIQASSVNKSVGAAANAAATVALTGSTPSGASGGVPTKCGGVWWSYSGTPTGGRIVVQSQGDILLDLDITTGGPGFIPINPPWESYANQDLTIWLAAGGAGVTGKVVANAWQSQ